MLLHSVWNTTAFFAEAICSCALDFLLSPSRNAKTRQGECCRADANATKAQLADRLDLLDYLALQFDLLDDLLLFHMN